MATTCLRRRIYQKLSLNKSMDLTNRTIIKDLFKKYGAKPEKYLGQHFILSKKALAQMVAAAEIKKNDTIIEIGPGLGALTQELAKIPHPLKKSERQKIIAIEKDPLMISILEETMADYKNIKVIKADARDAIGFGNLSLDKYKIVANLPYNIATFLIHQWLELKNPPELVVLMIQKEVAQRICSKPPHNNLLGISVQFYADAKIINYVSKKSFWPRPKVDSAIIKMISHISAASASDRQQMLQKDTKLFFKVVKAGFSQPRKQLIGNLTKKLNIPKEKLLEMFKNLNISERVRAENLTLEQWIGLSSRITTPNPSLVRRGNKGRLSYPQFTPQNLPQ